MKYKLGDRVFAVGYEEITSFTIKEIKITEESVVYVSNSGFGQNKGYLEEHIYPTEKEARAALIKDMEEVYEKRVEVVKNKPVTELN